MIQATQLKRGMCIKHDNDLYRVVEAQHKTPGNLRGLVQAKIRSLKTGAISDHRFRSVDMVERAIMGASVSNVSKPAKMETGLVVGVPPFIAEGDRIRIDTATGSYIERVK